MSFINEANSIVCQEYTPLPDAFGEPSDALGLFGYDLQVAPAGGARLNPEEGILRGKEGQNRTHVQTRNGVSYFRPGPALSDVFLLEMCNKSRRIFIAL